MIAAVVFDLDGVIVSTDEYHYLAWKELADRLGIAFDRDKNQALRGVGRMESLDIVLGARRDEYTLREREVLADSKNRRYRQLLDRLSPSDIMPGALRLLDELKALGIKRAIGSSSKNTPIILDRIGLHGAFDAVVDGNRVRKSKPDPAVFLLAAQDLGIPPANCVVVEDAKAGIDAALAAGMKAFAVGYAATYSRADGHAPSLETVHAEQLIGV